MFSDKVFDFVVEAVRKEERKKQEDAESQKPKHYSLFQAEKKAGDLVGPCKKQATHHRQREQIYVKKLEEGEKELREKGISMEVFDQGTGTYMNYNTLASGNISMGGPSQQQFQPRIDQKMLDAVKNAKAKMLEHRGKAEEYEKQAGAFACNPEFAVRLSVEDIHYFRLGEQK